MLPTKAETISNIFISQERLLTHLPESGASFVELAHDCLDAGLATGAVLDDLVSDPVSALGLLDVGLRLCNEAVHLRRCENTFGALLLWRPFVVEATRDRTLVPVK